MQTKLASPAQANFLRTLAQERMTQINDGNPNPFATVDDFLRAANVTQMTSYDASQLIGRLKALKPDRSPDIPDVVFNSPRWGRGNRPGACSGCGAWVGQDEGFYWLTSGGQWRVHHKQDACPEAAPEVKRVDVAEGFYKTPDGTVVQVYMTKNSRLAGKVLTDAGSFVYQSGAVRLAEFGERMTPQEVANEQCIRMFGAPIGSPELLARAVQYGTSTGNCMFCRKVLSTPESNPALGGKGYGPKCATTYGLPWGDITNVTTGQIMTRSQWREQFRAHND